jgi:hypothetical protein
VNRLDRLEAFGEPTNFGRAHQSPDPTTAGQIAAGPDYRFRSRNVEITTNRFDQAIDFRPTQHGLELDDYLVCGSRLKAAQPVEVDAALDGRHLEIPDECPPRTIAPAQLVEPIGGSEQLIEHSRPRVDYRVAGRHQPNEI